MAQRLPIGFDPLRGGAGAKLVGSRIPLGFARRTGANFLSSNILATVRARLATPEPAQRLNEESVWADLLSPLALCFNLFGELSWNPVLCSTATRAWWSDAPSGPVTPRFSHSPGRRDPLFLGNRATADVMFEIERFDGTLGVIAVVAKYHDYARAEPSPLSRPLARYVEIAERSRIFRRGFHGSVIGTSLQQMWLGHLLVLSMLQHPSRWWTWGRLVLLHPSENPSVVAAAREYRETLAEPSTFEPRTIESLLDSDGALPGYMVEALRNRYL